MSNGTAEFGGSRWWRIAEQETARRRVRSKRAFTLELVEGPVKAHEARRRRHKWKTRRTEPVKKWAVSSISTVRGRFL
jgi:hypothetical protein